EAVLREHGAPGARGHPLERAEQMAADEVAHRRTSMSIAQLESRWTGSERRSRMPVWRGRGSVRAACRAWPGTRLGRSLALPENETMLRRPAARVAELAD